MRAAGPRAERVVFLLTVVSSVGTVATILIRASLTTGGKLLLVALFVVAAGVGLTAGIRQWARRSERQVEALRRQGAARVSSHAEVDLWTGAVVSPRRAYVTGWTLLMAASVATVLMLSLFAEWPTDSTAADVTSATSEETSATQSSLPSPTSAPGSGDTDTSTSPPTATTTEPARPASSSTTTTTSPTEPSSTEPSST